MSKNVQLIILHIAVAVLCFIGALVFFNNRMGMEKGSAVAELANPSYPVLEIGNDTSSYNLMAGYKEDIDLSLVRNQITLTNNKNAVILKLHDYDYDITAIQYTLFEKTPDKPTETGTLNQLTKNKKKNIKLGTLTFKNTLSENKVYYLKMAVRLNDSTRIYFYTKVQSGSGYHLDDYLAFVLKFHNNLFDKATMDENASYLETSADTIDDNLESVSINSGREAVSFGNMEVKQETKPRITLQEMNNTYTVIRVNTILSTEISDGVIQYYDLSETYKLRYTADRMYLLDYERTMDAYYNESIIDSANNLISLGIQNEKNISYIYSDKGYRVCFAVEGQLWYYDYQSSDMYKIYSLASENISDIRNATGNHGIKLLSMDDKGNIFYLVYGYINRGRHEGMNGIQVMKYDAKTNCNEEISFLSTSLPYDSMKEDLEKFSYLNSKSVFYCILEGDLHEIDLEKKKDKILESGLVNESLTASKDQSIIAIEKEQNLYKNKQIEMIDLESGKKQNFTTGSDKRIRAVGFLSNDFIYGEANAVNVSKSSNGTVSFPITKIHIVDINGKTIKEYQKAGRYIMSTQIKGSILEMTLGKRTGGKIQKTGTKDYIRYKEKEESDAVTLTSKYTDTYWTQLYLKFPNYVYIQVVPDLLLTKIMVNEDDVTLNLSNSGEQLEQYFVYASGTQKAVYTNLTEAIARAYTERGNVIDSKENVLWKCIYADYAQVAGMDNVVKVQSDAKSLAGCLSMIAAVNGKEAAPDSIDIGKGSIEQLMKKYSGHTARNLTGCTVDEILYYVSQGSPVLAKLNSNRYVIVMSYNATKIRYLDSVTGKSTAASRTDVTNRLEKSGKVFYSYIAD